MILGIIILALCFTPFVLGIVYFLHRIVLRLYYKIKLYRLERQLMGKFKAASAEQLTAFVTRLLDEKDGLEARMKEEPRAW